MQKYNFQIFLRILQIYNYYLLSFHKINKFRKHLDHARLHVHFHAHIHVHVHGHDDVLRIRTLLNERKKKFVS